VLRSHKLIRLLCVFSLVVIPTLTPGEAPQDFQKTYLRYRVETDQTATFYVGKEGSFKLVLFDQYGKRVAAPKDLKTTITVTTLSSVDEARKWMGSQKTKPQSVLQARLRKISIEPGQQAAQLTITHQQGAEDVTVSLVSKTAGVLYIFVESSGIAPGDTTVAVVKPKSVFQRRSVRPFDSVSAPLRMIPIAVQLSGDQFKVDQFKLDLQPAKPIIQTDQGCQVGYVKVILKTATNELVQAPKDIKVLLQVNDGYAWFEPDTLTIPEGDAISPEPAALMTKPGGVITVSASTNKINNVSITPVTNQAIRFDPGPHSTVLSLQKTQSSAYANGLDELELRVEALQEGRAIRPEEEGMAERTITFRFLGDAQGVKFQDGKSELTIPKGQQTGSIKLFSVRPVSDLKVVAESWNGLQGKISSGDGGVPLKFSFPWGPLFCALLGGILLPLLRQDFWIGLVRGAAAGIILFTVAFFGALLSDPQKIGTVSIALTKLPTESVLASFILGFLGSLLLGVIFAKRLQPAS